MIDNHIELTFDKKKVTDAFDDCFQVQCDNIKYVSADLATICVSEEIYQKYSGEKMALINVKDHKYINVILKPKKELVSNSIRITSYIKEALNVANGSEIFLCHYKTRVYNRFYLQKIDHIRENNIVISQADLNDLEMDVSHSKCELYEVFNSVTKESMIVKKSHIFVDPTLKKGSIKLNRKQRIFLGLELPLYLSEIRRAIIEKKCTEEEKALIYNIYTKDDYFLIDDTTYDEREQVKKILLEKIAYEIRVIPVIEAFYRPEKRSLRQKLTDFYVGKSTMSLICCRPYENDEGINVVRMTKSNMKLLGVEEMDMVRLQYKKTQIHCRVLGFDDEQLFLKTNLPLPMELVIGIPTHIRKKLHITELNTTIKVDRDTGFIFKRSINEQIVPILLTFFSSTIFSSVSELLPILLSIVLVPLVLYLNLSSKRNMRG